MLAPTVEKPESNLARYRLLAPSASVRVSPLCLGAMNIGTAWNQFMGDMDKETGFKLMDAFYDAGGNFIDTANAYQNEESEIWIGEWMKKRENRDQIVVATKFSTNYKMGERKGPMANFAGNSIKSLHMSVEASLKKLQTDYIDLLYVHWWDYTTSIEELMQGLDVLVKQGKVLYLGASDTPAWVVAKANQYARDHGMRQFSVYQGKWSASFRDMEREIIPMCKSEGMAICPWGSIGGGNFKTKAQVQEMKEKNEKGRNFTPPSDADQAVTEVLDKISKKLKVSITSVALAWVMSKTPYVFPIVGGRKIEHLKDNINAVSIKLSPEDVQEISSAIPFDIGFPSNVFGASAKTNSLVTSTAYHDWVEDVKAIQLDH